MKSVKLKNGLLVLGMIIACLAVCPQLSAQDTEITDEELTQYAQVSDKIDSLKLNMKQRINDAVKGNELMDGGKLYNKLNKAGDDEAKIAEIGASEEQMAAYNEIQESVKAYKAEFKSQYTSIVKDEIGAGVYNKVKKAVRADAEVKARFDAIVESLATQAEDVEGEE